MILYVLIAVSEPGSHLDIGVQYSPRYCIQLDIDACRTQVRLKRKKETPYPAHEWCVWYDFDVYNMISVEKNDREISGLHNI